MPACESALLKQRDSGLRPAWKAAIFIRFLYNLLLGTEADA